MRSEAGFGAAAVRHVSVRSGPWTAGRTDGHGRLELEWDMSIALPGL